MLILGLDVETTGLDPVEDRVIEIGAVLWHVERHMPVQIFSHLVVESPEVQSPQAAVDIHGITNEILHEFGRPADDALFKELNDMVAKAEFCMAHRRRFDQTMLTAMFKRHGHRLRRKPWIDTMTDLPFPPKVVYRNLTYVSAYHGFVNPFPHRAVTDVLTMFKIFDHYPLDKVLEKASSPMMLVMAKTSYDDRQLAKDAGFHWDAEAKGWFKEMKLIDLNAAEFPFEVDAQEVEE